MARRFLNKKTRPFFFVNDAGVRTRYVVIYGDEVDTENRGRAERRQLQARGVPWTHR